MAQAEGGAHVGQARSQEVDPDWSWLRKKAHAITIAKAFEDTIAIAILFNMGLMIIEVDLQAGDDAVPRWLHISNYGLLGLYMVELIAKIYVHRLSFFCDEMNIMDFAIVLADVVMIPLEESLGSVPAMSMLRIFRLVRLTRAFRAASMFPELKLLLLGFASAIKAIFWGIMMIVLQLTVWSILAVQLLNPINQELTEHYERVGCDRCPHAFESVWMSFLTFFQQVVAGDSWGEVSLPVLQYAPWAILILLPVLVSTQLGMLNLILAVICQAATQASAADENGEVNEDQQTMGDAEKLLPVFAEIDPANSCSLSQTGPILVNVSDDCSGAMSHEVSILGQTNKVKNYYDRRLHKMLGRIVIAWKHRAMPPSLD